MTAAHNLNQVRGAVDSRLAHIANRSDTDGVNTYGRLAGRCPMRDWMLPLSPVIAIAYFVAFPDKFGALISWAEAIVR